MRNEELKRCPFCGGEAHKRIAFPCDADGLEMNMYIVGCDTCDIEFSWLWDEEVAIELWNTRKPMDRIVEQLQHAKEMSVTDMGKSYNKGLDFAITLIKKAGGV